MAILVNTFKPWAILFLAFLDFRVADNRSVHSLLFLSWYVSWYCLTIFVIVSLLCIFDILTTCHREVLL